jgi:hypothetical protein
MAVVSRNDIVTDLLNRLEVSLQELKFIRMKWQRVECLQLACSHATRRQIHMGDVTKVLRVYDRLIS